LVLVINSGANFVFAGRAANAYILYIDGNYIAQTQNDAHSAGQLQYTLKINQEISAGVQHSLTVISSSLGIDNYGGIQPGFAPSQCDKKGITGDVKINNANNQLAIDLTQNGWNHYIGLTGEQLDIYGNGINKVKWSNPPKLNAGMTWFKTTFNTPNSNTLNNGVILIDIGANSLGVNRGHFYLNGYDMGHFNNIQYANIMVQRYYFIPKSYLIDNGGSNTLLFVEEYPNTNTSNIAVVSSTFIVPQR